MADLTQPSGAAYSSTGDLTANPGGITPASVAANDPSSARLAASLITRGAVAAAQSVAGQVFNLNFLSTTGSAIPTEADWRVRISMAPATASLFYNQSNPIMGPLYQTNGVIFPYTPSLSISHGARWNSTQLTHSNYASYFYEGSEINSFSINGEFTVQNIQEGQYLMAAIHFFRSCTKMFFGQSALAGTPPPVVYLDGYGKAYLPKVPCVVTAFNHTMPADVDYINVPIGISLDQSNIAGQIFNLTGAAVPQRLPTTSTISVTLQPIYSRNNIQNNFTLEKFAAGALIGNGFV
jgi:hypothetical protein